ncbi:uncharacterized protein LOC115757938 isoform X1 [Drosophila novamexicana]|uniref:uncharacterized protein LOC115757938 isoform X1 n=1 Tax=Drosophila novamexicana TaxID=47314 RepID=UPI0011E60780|nr:uncharacterized protein LOC115757938 isoform X1 [Drosophila novamexicana]
MKLYELLNLMLLLFVWHLESISGQPSPSTNMPCMERCMMNWQNEVANAQMELNVDLDQPQYEQMLQLEQEQLAECRLSVHYFDCTLKCMFDKFTLPFRCRQQS